MITTIGLVDIIITGPAHTQPAGIDAIVQEQDVAMLLGSNPVIVEPDESYDTLVTRMEQQQPLEPGTVLVSDTTPRIFTAVTCDVDQQPICREEWIVACLQQIFTECMHHRIQTLAMPVLGVAHGRIDRHRSMTLLENILRDSIIQYPRKILIFENENTWGRM